MLVRVGLMALIPTVIKRKTTTEQTIEDIVDSTTGLLYMMNGGLSGGYIPPKNRKDIEDRIRQSVHMDR